MRVFKIVALLLGASLLYWIVHKVGLGGLISGLQRLGWRLTIPIVLIFPCYLLYTTSWQLFLKRFDHHSIPFWSLLKIKLAGEAANTLTPLNFAGGDPFRVWLLSRNFPVTISGASVVVDRTLQILAIIGLIFFGNIAALFKLDLPPSAKNLLGITAILLVAFILLLLFHQTRGLFRTLSRLAARLRIRTFSEKTLKSLEEIDQHLIDFYRQDRRLFFLLFLLHLAARIPGIIELIVLGHLLGVPIGIWEALFFAAVIPVVNLVGVIVPGTWGVLEGVVSSLFLTLHWDPANGLVLQFARRLRALFWILIGMIFILLARANPKKTGQKIGQKIGTG